MYMVLAHTKQTGGRGRLILGGRGAGLEARLYTPLAIHVDGPRFTSPQKME